MVLKDPDVLVWDGCSEKVDCKDQMVLEALKDLGPRGTTPRCPTTPGSSRSEPAAAQPIWAGALCGEVSKAPGRIAALKQTLRTCPWVRGTLPSWLTDLGALKPSQEEAAGKLLPLPAGRAGPSSYSYCHIMLSAPQPPAPTRGPQDWGAPPSWGRQENTQTSEWFSKARTYF